MHKDSPMTIYLHEDYVKIVENKNGIKTEKVGDLGSFLSVLRSVDTSFATPILPMNCRGLYKNGSTVYVLMYFEKTIIEGFKYHNNTYKIPVPRTLVLCTLNDKGNNKYSFVTSTFFPIKEPYLNSQDIDLYFWPFPNQYAGWRGDICWGTEPAIQTFKRDCELFNMGSIYQIYFAANANDDYGWQLQGERALSMPAWLSTATDFPNDKLRPHGRKLHDLIKEITTPQITAGQPSAPAAANRPTF